MGYCLGWVIMAGQGNKSRSGHRIAEGWQLVRRAGARRRRWSARVRGGGGGGAMAPVTLAGVWVPPLRMGERCSLQARWCVAVPRRWRRLARVCCGGMGGEGSPALVSYRFAADDSPARAWRRRVERRGRRTLRCAEPSRGLMWRGRGPRARFFFCQEWVHNGRFSLSHTNRHIKR